MLKKLAKCVREYKGVTILTLVLMIGEAIIETLIPFITATFLINQIQEQGKNLDMGYILSIGGLLVLMAVAPFCICTRFSMLSFQAETCDIRSPYRRSRLCIDVPLVYS